MAHTDFSIWRRFGIELHTAQVYPGGMITSEQLAEKMKVEILADIQAGIVPASVQNFSELHDYVDANCYGGTEALLDELDAGATSDEEHRKSLDTMCDLMNPAMEIINEWLANGGPLREISQMDVPVQSAGDGSVIASISDKTAHAENIAAIDRLVVPGKYRHIVAWGKWLGFTPQTVLKSIELAKAEDAPEDAIQKIDGRWIRVGDIANQTNRDRVAELARCSSGEMINA